MFVFRSLLFSAASFVSAGAALAIPVTPTSYDMLNGNSGSFNYWDDSYTGAGNKRTNGAALSGGLGDLTDGVIASRNWNLVEGPIGPQGPYVGWTINPKIVFRFAAVTDFQSMTFHFDDSDGYGGVRAPGSVSVQGSNHAIAEPSGPSPFAYTVDLTGLSTDTLTVDIFRKGGWVFLSEVQFDAVPPPAVPLPGGLLLLGSALAGVGLYRRKRHQG